MKLPIYKVAYFTRYCKIFCIVKYCEDLNGYQEIWLNKILYNNTFEYSAAGKENEQSF